MASQMSLQVLQRFYDSKYVVPDHRGQAMAIAPQSLSIEAKEQGVHGLSKKNYSLGYFAGYYDSSQRLSSQALSSMASSVHSNKTSGEVGKLSQRHEMRFSRVNCLVWILHESARSFSCAVESLQLSGTGPALAMAWVGKDVHQWHKKIAYKVVVYVLLKIAIDVETLHSHEHSNESSPVREILFPTVNSVGKYIENQLNMRQSGLVQWFKEVELPRIAGFFLPLLKSWSMEYARSGVAGIILATSCCSAVGKLGSERTCSHLLELKIEDALLELLESTRNLVSVDKFHRLATEAGFEEEFLTHFGTMVFQYKRNEDLKFWIGLAQEKLSAALQKESLLSGRQSFGDNVDSEVRADSLATLGIFAYLGRRTRVFLSGIGMSDLDEHVKDFLSHLECGGLFSYPELSSILAYQIFMEVVVDEIGWLDFYASFSCMEDYARRSTKHSAVQAEKEMILTAVFSVCYDVFSGYAHFSRSTLKPLDAELPKFLLQSQSLLKLCLEDCWAAYEKPGEFLKFSETGADDHTSFLRSNGTVNFYAVSEEQQNPCDLMAQVFRKNPPHESEQEMTAKLSRTDMTNIMAGTSAAKSVPESAGLIRKYSLELASTSCDIWMGTQLLFADFAVAAELLVYQSRGHRMTRRERRRLRRTLNDIASLIPITILMLLPVSAIGHAAILAVIRKYMPFLIPSPYSSERLDVLKQFERTKKMQVQFNLEDPSSRVT